LDVELNATAERATRREIRRAFGESAIANMSALDTRITGLEAAHNTSMMTISADTLLLKQRIDGLERTAHNEWARMDTRLAGCEGSCLVNDGHIKEVYAAFAGLSLLGRLRWLFFGRHT